jgi:hypothetical protein
MTSTPAAQKPRPLHTEKIGALSASIWLNTAAEGRTFYSVTFERTYRGTAMSARPPTASITMICSIWPSWRNGPKRILP